MPRTIHDISVKISDDLPVWPGDRRPRIDEVMKILRGDVANVSEVSMSIHTGTHLDAPNHFVEKGIPAWEIPLETLVGRALVVDLPGTNHIDASVLESLDFPKNVRRILLRTSNSTLWSSRRSVFNPEYVALTADAASWIVERGIALVGVDYLSVQPFADKSQQTHTTLLSAGVIILEGLDLSEVRAGEYTLYCLPLRIACRDGAPARAILIADN
jgi:arylformamidase